MGKQKTKMKDKVKNRIIRLSANENEMFVRKSKGFPSVSSMVRKAVEMLDNDAVSQRIERVKALTELYSSFDTQLSRAGNNLNQVAKTLHRLDASGLVTESYVTNVVGKAVIDTYSLLCEVRRNLDDVVRTAVRSI